MIKRGFYISEKPAAILIEQQDENHEVGDRNSLRNIANYLPNYALVTSQNTVHSRQTRLHVSHKCHADILVIPIHVACLAHLIFPYLSTVNNIL
jgi:hypothetical protein